MMSVLRLGHRLARDPRISTHCGLVARALGADEIIYSGEHDESLLKGIEETVQRWGGPFSVRYEANWKKCIAEYRKKGYKITHLTMYGVSLKKSKMKKHKKMLIIIGGEKVQPEVYQMSDYNVSIENQPHSEVAALAVFLNECCRPKKFRNAKMRIVPQEKGKRVIEEK
ncbi:MAG: tRNA (cytidine(56)-2'-O)-methyltransferase [Candidatus Aenigmarchaeota archaeon]|nr:tRNA (cytidine(56)-2'-O)-methyltransferase [Candidatus Aenigmarchaeota archaeon]